MSFYRGRFAELYDLFYQDKPYADEARFVYERLRFHAGAAPRRVLELACGTGTHAFELAKLGCAVTATDCSFSMLDVARRKNKNAETKVTFSLCDMRALPNPEQPYDAVICLFDSIGYVQTDANLSSVLDGVRANLQPGGLFLFEFWHAPAMTKKSDPIRVKRIAGDEATIIRVSQTSLMPERSLARVAYDVYELKNDATYWHFAETQCNRYFTVAEMKENAAVHGFEPLASYAGFAPDTEITDDTWHVVTVWRAA